MSNSKKYVFPRVNYTIPLEGNFRNEKGIKIKYRYSQGEDTIVAKEQSQGATKGYLFVKTNPMLVEDPLIQEMLDLMIKNGANIIVHDPVAIAKQQNENIEYTVEALTSVKSMEEVELITIAYKVLGKNSMRKDPQTLRTMLYAVAQEHPKQIMDAIAMKEANKLQYFVAEALAMGIIVENIDKSEVVFASNKNRLTYISKGEDAIEATARYFETQEGKADKSVVAQTIADKLKGEANNTVAEKTTTTRKAKTQAVEAEAETPADNTK